ncbi:type IV toxin-antitoxin system AbiEi family antitoxin domain-containing protein [Pseudonocardia sp.]|uniref:type IV toxin-antitoxin system AbiEi family antitoxin domain-containing protein n=1 Tax=Pseudonocardia sp. TaxID=60912 RepID=UPI00261E9E19|nr:type IV toxin-antitoxin system AbiEi family antitoxin domain-containing protein [Pseudonocardia sp.]
MDLQLRSELLARGWTDADLRRLRRSGELAPLRRGSYRPGPADGPDTPEARHALLVRATLPHLGPGWVVSHQSAAVLLGLPVWDVPLDRVHVSRDGTGGGRVTRGVHRHVGRLADTEVVRLGGVRLTGPGRTVVDVAGTVAFEQAVVIADAALAPFQDDRPALLDRAGLLAALARGGRIGRSAARRVVAFADGGARSPGESRSRVAMWLAGLPAPVLQFEVRGPDGRLLGIVDFGWPELRTVGEFDGRVKYGRLLRPGRHPEDAVFAEKLREDAIRGTDLGMVRWTWPDLDRFEPVAQRLHRTFRAAHAPVIRAWPDMRS